MTRRFMFRRSLRHYWRTHLAVVAGVAAAVAVMAGALLVGDSVRGSLRRLVDLRLGRVTHVATSENFFRQQLAADISAAPQARGAFSVIAPAIVLEGGAAHEKSRRRATGVQVFGVDESFFHDFFPPAAGAPSPPALTSREALLSPALAAEFDAQPGDAIMLRVQRPSDVQVDSLHGSKDNLGRSIRLTVRGTLSAEAGGEFSLAPKQGAARSVFLPLARLQQELGLPARANTLLAAETHSDYVDPTGKRPSTKGLLPSVLHDLYSFDDVGVRMLAGAHDRQLVVQSEQVLIPDGVAEAVRLAARQTGVRSEGVFAYLATTIRAENREIPYSLVTAAEVPESLGARGQCPLLVEKDGARLPALWLNEWAMRDLGALAGERVTLEYLVWEEGGRLGKSTADFSLCGSVPLNGPRGLAAQKWLAPQFPGISESLNLSDWNPPFPVDLKRVRPKDEEYWHKYKTTPKAIIPLEVGQKLWGTRYGKLTSLRIQLANVPDGSPRGDLTIREFGAKLRETLDPAATGMHVLAVREESAAASQGAINFGEYFAYFSFFLLVSAVLLTGLFFRLGIEQRLREIGLLRALGFSERAVRRLYLREGIGLAGLGTLLGLAGAAGYAWLMIYGLRTWWIGASGTTYLELSMRPASLQAGALAGMLSAILGIALTLRGLRRAEPRALLHGESLAAATPPTAGESAQGNSLLRRPAALLAIICGGLAAVLLGLTAMRKLDAVPAFFGAGSLLLAALLAAARLWLARNGRHTHQGAHMGAPLQSLGGLGMRNAAWRPGRSLLCIALLASATFILVAVEAFRRDAAADSRDPKSGTGGYALAAESLLPVVRDPNTPEGLRGLNLGDDEIAALAGVRFAAFRVRPGDDASCLNLYQPRNPKLLGVAPSFIAQSRFSFTTSLAETPEEKENPWLLLLKTLPNGAVPAIADANSLTYVLQRKVGDEMEIAQATDPATGKPLRLKFVAALRDSLFQSEVLIADAQFLRLFPYVPGSRLFLVDAPSSREAPVMTTLEEGLADFGFDAQPAGERLAAFHRVENTYISTFQALGGLGLLLGTVGLAAVMLRNVLERRRELALLRAVGYTPQHLARLVLIESALLLALGLGAGVLAALVAVAPAIAERASALPLGGIGLLLAGVLAVGLAAALGAVRAVGRMPLLESLRSE